MHYVYTYNVALWGSGNFGVKQLTKFTVKSLPETSIVSQLAKNFPTFRATKMHYRVHMSLAHVSILSLIDPVHAVISLP